MSVSTVESKIVSVSDMARRTNKVLRCNDMRANVDAKIRRAKIGSSQVAEAIRTRLERFYQPPSGMFACMYCTLTRVVFRFYPDASRLALSMLRVRYVN
jgi:hypothetical protein